MMRRVIQRQPPPPTQPEECAPCQKAAAVNVLVQACKADSGELKCDELQRMAANGEIDVDGLADQLETKAKDPNTRMVARTVRRHMRGRRA
jgi:hypothetical protein